MAKTPRNLSAEQSAFKDVLETMGGSLHLRDVLDDFLFMCSTAMRQAVHVFKFHRIDEPLEAGLRVLKNRYAVPNDFGEALAHMVKAMEIEPHDFLGHFYGAIDAMNERTGQFFTPDALSELIANMGFDRAHYEETIAKGQRYNILEPCVGSGGMIIQAAKQLREWGAHPSTYYVDCTDIDIRCCRMAYVQFTLLHIPAIVRHGNTLSLEMWDTWQTMAMAMNPLAPRATPALPEPERKPSTPPALAQEKSVTGRVATLRLVRRA